MRRYAAKLIFQFRVDVNGNSGKRRICEERILNLQASSAPVALRQSQRWRNSAEYSYTNDAGNMVYFEFIGVMDLVELGLEAGPDEVRHDIYNRVEPMERRDRLIPSDQALLDRVSGKAP